MPLMHEATCPQFFKIPVHIVIDILFYRSRGQIAVLLRRGSVSPLREDKATPSGCLWFLVLLTSK